MLGLQVWNSTPSLCNTGKCTHVFHAGQAHSALTGLHPQPLLAPLDADNCFFRLVAASPWQPDLEPVCLQCEHTWLDAEVSVLPGLSSWAEEPQAAKLPVYLIIVSCKWPDVGSVLDPGLLLATWIYVRVG